MTAKKILVIDDDSAVRFTLKRILVREGFEVVDAPDGRKGIELFQLDPPDLVITDIIMPEQEGIETIVVLKNTCPYAPIIAISGGGRIGNEDLLRMAARLGADAILHKPFGEAELLDIVKAKLAA
jgi:DNA-binding response OmpR family regulator